MPDVRPEILAFYETGREAARLSDGSLAGPLEFERTTELISRFLAPAPLRVLDVGGGPGSYAEWLTARGDQVLLLDPVPLHVDQARGRGVAAEVGDARQLRVADASFDVVLLMGPLYHLIDAADRAAALGHARRVLRPGGMLIATAISRFAALLDLLVRLDRLHEPGVIDTVETAVATGVFLGHEHGLFTTAFFHLPTQLREEITVAGFESCEVLSIEGPGFLVNDFDARWADPSRRHALLRAARLIEREPEMLGAASHLMAVARAPETDTDVGSVATVHGPLKYAVVERERRFLVAHIPDGVVEVKQIVDHYLDGTRLRLREVTDAHGAVTRKLGQKVRLTSGPIEIACTSVYLDAREWELLRALPSRTLRKTRHIIERDGIRLAVDELDGGTLLAEIDDADATPRAVPQWLEVLREVTTDEQWTGAHLAT